MGSPIQEKALVGLHVIELVLMRQAQNLKSWQIRSFFSSSQSMIFFVLLVSHLRLDQMSYDQVEGWLNILLSYHFTRTSIKAIYYTKVT